MKQSSTLVFILLFFCPSLSTGQILLGIKAGYGLLASIGKSNPPFDASLKVDDNCFFIAIPVKERRPNKITNLGGEIQYYQVKMSGHQIVGGLGQGANCNYNINLNFLNLMIKPEFVFGTKIKFIVNTGLYFQILIQGILQGIYTTYGPPPLSEGIINNPASKYFNLINLGILGGIGIEIPVSKKIILNFSSDGLIGITRLAKSSLVENYFNLMSLQVSGCIVYNFNYPNLK
jgi:hypothetical protein